MMVTVAASATSGASLRHFIVVARECSTSGAQRLEQRQESDQRAGRNRDRRSDVTEMAQPRQMQFGHARQADCRSREKAEADRDAAVTRAAVAGWRVDKRRKQPLPAVVIPQQQVRARQQHQSRDDPRACEGSANRNSDHEDVQDDREIGRRAECRGSREEQKEGGGELRGADETIVPGRREEAVEEVPDRIGGRQRRKAVAGQLHPSRRHETEREQHPHDDREGSPPARFDQSVMPAIEACRHKRSLTHRPRPMFVVQYRRSMRNVRAALGLAFGVTVFSAACGGAHATAPSPLMPAAVSGSPTAYLNELVDLMQANSINRTKIEWANFRTIVIARGQGAPTIADTYPAIAVALTLLDDHHSFYTSASGMGIGNPSGRRCAAPSAPNPSVPGDIGYVRVGSFSGTDATAVRSFADSVQAQIRASDRPGLAGWIVDLRGNAGGNMWPMIAGVGAVLGDGTAGYFVPPIGTWSAWGYSSGAASVNGFVQAAVSSVYVLDRTFPRVAVLTDNLVASSGEAIAIAFRARPAARSFGMATCGLSTANGSYRLSDGGMLYLTTALMADRTGTSYGDAVVADEILAGDAEVVARAIAWIRAE